MYTKTTLIGYAGRDAESRFTPTGQQVTNVSVAATVGYGDNKRTIWFRVSFWQKLAEIAAGIQKGAKLFVEGELQPDESGNPRQWGDPPKASFELRGTELRFLSAKSESVQQDEFVAEDDIPF